MALNKSTAKKSTTRNENDPTVRFESAKVESLFPVLDAVAWMDEASTAQIAQFAGIDPRTAGKLLKNANHLGIVDRRGTGYILLTSYPYQGTGDQKRDVVREALVRLPILVSARQFMSLGDPLDAAMRKAATVNRIVPFNIADYAPMLAWAEALNALKPGLVQEDLVDSAAAAKVERHGANKDSRVAFLSHSSSDKPFVRQLAADLKAAGIDVWLDEQRIRVGESIPERISQGLAESDFFLLAVSKASVDSEWVKKELNGALINEVQRRAVHILPLKLDDTKMPAPISDKKYADFSLSYKAGLADLVSAMKGN
ncbi:toll/interleukin-1 receptor domain-containing protein [Sphingomonas xinjiangensis]|uniref:TIR domain-containing protein n=1 Tax=Sphingomonas xinjiangensis TaxID=643568 RepID=A0A840YA25_9SPHN|nr:toll/interleukin-1 receptor domain-containing protein [Sphingomonas xinjiangensis]MBB5710187.1 hypothetical protein [Sphingomonas xinjiangensis]